MREQNPSGDFSRQKSNLASSTSLSVLSLSLLTCFAVGFFKPVLGHAQDITGSLAMGSRWAETRESRRTQAKEWLAEVDKIERQIPTLSPAEKEWLRVEVDEEIAPAGGKSTLRANRAMLSREGLSRSAKPVAQAMVSILEALSSPLPLSESNETMLWARLAYIGLDNNFWGKIAGLGQLGVLEHIPKPDDAVFRGSRDYQDALLSRWAFRADEIIGRFVLPYVDKLPKDRTGEVAVTDFQSEGHPEETRTNSKSSVHQLLRIRNPLPPVRPSPVDGS